VPRLAPDHRGPSVVLGGEQPVELGAHQRFELGRGAAACALAARPCTRARPIPPRRDRSAARRARRPTRPVRREPPHRARPHRPWRATVAAAPSLRCPMERGLHTAVGSGAPGLPRRGAARGGVSRSGGVAGLRQPRRRALPSAVHLVPGGANWDQRAPGERAARASRVSVLRRARRRVRTSGFGGGTRRKVIGNVVGNVFGSTL
jgi:hypothetical protein